MTQTAEQQFSRNSPQYWSGYIQGMLGTLQDIILDKEPMVADVLCCLRPEILEAVAASKDTTIPQDALTILVARRLRGD